jgi:plastocyanin
LKSSRVEELKGWRAVFLVLALFTSHLLSHAAPAQVQTGIVEGRVTFDGQVPPPVIVIQDGGQQPVLYLDGAGGLRFAVAFIADARTGGVSPSDAALVNQRHFIFEPQVLAVRVDQPVRFSSEDSANHNVRARDANDANTFSVNTATGSPGPFVHRFGAAAFPRPVELSCDIHPWMAAWVYVFNHDQFAVTGADGTFRIDRIPVGRHTLSVRHPAGGLARDTSVDIRPGVGTRVDIRFVSADLGRRSP